MRDLYEPEMDALEAEPFEFEVGVSDTEGPFDEVEEMDLASELLTVSSDQELDQFLGDLIKKAGRAAGAVIRSPVGQALGGILKGAAKKALPMIGSAVGGYLGGSSGAQMGSQLASKAGQMFGLELEGLSPEDQEFEVARRFVRFGGNAVRNAVRAPAAASPRAAAQAAAVQAAQRHAPGLLAPAPLAVPGPGGPLGRSGRWFRRGRNIVIINCNC